MKHSIRRSFAALAIIASLVVIQSIYATGTIKVEGTIDSISTKPNMIVVDGTEIYGVSFNKLENHNISLEVGEVVSVDVYEYICKNGTVKYMAYSITVGEVTIQLREVPTEF